MWVLNAWGVYKSLLGSTAGGHGSPAEKHRQPPLIPEVLGAPATEDGRAWHVECQLQPDVWLSGSLCCHAGSCLCLLGQTVWLVRNTSSMRLPAASPLLWRMESILTGTGGKGQALVQYNNYLSKEKAWNE